MLGDSQLPNSNCRAVSFQLPVANCQLTASNFQLTTSNFQLQTGKFNLATCNFQLPATISIHQLSTATWQLSAAACCSATQKLDQQMVDHFVAALEHCTEASH
jgi:hypothetical protein